MHILEVNDFNCYNRNHLQFFEMFFEWHVKYKEY